jgi:glutamate-ammonia-ligase adenylyltransferase
VSLDEAAAGLAELVVTAPLLADPKRARSKLADLVSRAESAPDAVELVRRLAAGRFRDLMLGLADHSPFLWQLAYGDPARLARLATDAPDRFHGDLVARIAGLSNAVRSGQLSRPEVAGELRRARGSHALLVALADIGGVWAVERVTQALSAFADASVAAGVNVILTEAAAGGNISLPDPDDPGVGSGFVVLALGKHGARELNYSSDIDLVVFFDPDTSALADRGEAATFYTRVAQQLAKLLQERTADGYVHRVDYRLRPDPGSTPTAVSLSSAYTYYETVGQNWERAAMIKARPIAGDLTLGERFLNDLTPFIWRKYFDFASIADVHAMKRQIHAVRGHDEIAVA